MRRFNIVFEYASIFFFFTALFVGFHLISKYTIEKQISLAQECIEEYYEKYGQNLYTPVTEQEYVKMCIKRRTEK